MINANIMLKNKSYLKYSIFSVVLITKPEQFTKLFSRSKSQLELSRELVKFKAQGVLDVTLRLECDGGGWSGAPGT